MASDRRKTSVFHELIDAGLLEIGDGYRAKNSELAGTGPLFLRAGHLTDTHISFEGVERFRAELADRVKPKMAKVGDTVITTKGNSTGRTSYVTSRMPQFVYSPHLSYWRSLDHIRLVPGFLRYWSRGNEFVNQLQGMKASTDMAPYLSLTDQRRLRITLPPASDQKAIAHILGTLDDKIELNRRMNETLEAMARAIFKSWFVDFDPVLAKAEGRDPGLPKPIADLFPTTFQDSSLGHIPQGWRVDSIYEIANVIYGAPFASSLFNSEKRGTPLIRIRDLADESPAVFTTEVHPKGYLLKPGDIAVGMDGEFRAYLWAGVESWLNQRVCVFAPKPGYSAVFVRNSIFALLAQVEATETATTVIHIGKNDIDRFTVIIPNVPVVEAFKRQCQPWYDRIVANKQQSRTLAALRDALLPKLLAGEIRVVDVEKTIRETV
jgi:type I restriction enzyme S subunit